MSALSRSLRLSGGAALALAASLLLAGCHARSGPAPAAAPEDEVNVGYGTQPAGNVTTSVTSITEQEMARAHGKRMEDVLQGVPGLTVLRSGGSYTLRIRGAQSLSGSDEPLVVVNGVPTTVEALFELSPQEVKRIDILKDAGAAAVYGSRGGNGVILVTTRGGPGGE